jgi:hypothetical protein
VGGALAEREHRRVDLFPDLRQFEEPRDGGDVVARDGITECLMFVE